MADTPQNPELPLSSSGGPGNLIPIDIEQEMKKSYLDYAMSVIVGRALPDVRDGLKPVQRRILYGMLGLGLRPNRPHRKCARISGEVVGKYHPHGEGSVYDTLVRLAQPFTMRAPLVDGQGNFGSVDGDPPAAMRYTEARMTAFAEALLADIDLDTVDFRPNYDDSEREPEYLPGAAPNLLVNGSAGIAVGMATNIPPHNLNEIVDAAILVLRQPDATLDEVLEIVQGPDFPTGATICGREGFVRAYQSGRGHVTVRAKTHTEPLGRDREAIIVTELPYQVNKSRMIEATAGMVNDKKIEGISDIRDESDRHGMRIVYELKRGEEPEVVLNNLYKHTQLQTGSGIILLAIVDSRPRELPLLEYLHLFNDHRADVIRRRTDHLLKKARDREHILLGFQTALDFLDEIIALIRAAGSPAEARQGLMAGFAPDPENPHAEGVERVSFSERQAQAIIELQLQRLTGMERQKILDELAEIQKRIASYLEILGSEEVLNGVIISELEEIKRKFGNERRSEIGPPVGNISMEDLIADEDMVVTMSHNGYLKRTPLDTYRKQSRGGRGRIGMGTRDDDFIEDLFIASTHTFVLVFTNLGRVYWLKVYNIPDVGITAKGKNIVNLIAFQPDEQVQGFLPVKEFSEELFIVMATRKGVIKKCNLEVFSRPLSRGIIALGLDDDDELIAARLSTPEEHIVVATYRGKAIRFGHDEVRAMGRPARGVRAIKLDADDHVIGMVCVREDQMLLSVAEEGYGKRTKVDEYRLTGRGGKGVINVKITKKTGNIVALLKVDEEAELMMITRNGKIIRIDTDKIRKTGRGAQGVRLVNLEDSDQVAAAARIPLAAADDDEEEGEGQPELFEK